MLNNQKVVLSTLYHLIGKDNFVVTGSLIDYVNLGENEIVNDIDIVVCNKDFLEKLNPYYKPLKIKDINNKAIPHVRKVYIYNILNVKVEIFLNDEFFDIEVINFLEMDLQFHTVLERKRGLLNFSTLAKEQKDNRRLFKYNKKLNKYVSNKF